MTLASLMLFHHDHGHVTVPCSCCIQSVLIESTFLPPLRRSRHYLELSEGVLDVTAVRSGISTSEKEVWSEPKTCAGLVKRKDYTNYYENAADDPVVQICFFFFMMHFRSLVWLMLLSYI